MSLVLVALTLAAHLICMNVASAGPLLVVWMDWKSYRGCDDSSRAGRVLTLWSLIALILGVILGLILGWLLWTETYAAVIQRIWYKVHFGIWEIVFSLVLALACLWLWTPTTVPSGKKRTLRSLCAALSSTNLLYHFPPLLFVISHMVRSGQTTGEPIAAAMFRQKLVDVHLAAHTTHFWLASIAVSGLVPILDYWYRTSNTWHRTSNTTVSSNAAVSGGRIALVASVLQIPVGIWILATSPAMMGARLLGGNIPASLAFGAAMLTALSMMHRLANIAFGDLNRRALIVTCGMMGAVVFLMTLALQFSRGG